MDRLIRLDERTPEQVENAIRWSQRDDFWKSNILSPKKLREKYDNVYINSIVVFDIKDYDFIILGDVLEHIPKELIPGVLAELRCDCHQQIWQHL